ncbi:TPA: hypothetical protein ACSPMB_000076 [Pseudomonas aeruginosa]
MKLFVLFGQRKCDYPGQYALEALACMDEVGQSDNPDYLDSEHAKYQESQEFDRLSLIPLEVSEKDIRRIMYPEDQVVSATVIEPK